MLEELRTGATNAEIGIRLGIQIGTVKFHARNIRRKLDLEDREALAAWRPPLEPERKDRRRLLAPLALLGGFWKPAGSIAAVAVVGGAVVAAGLLAYALVNDGEGDEDFGLPAAESTTETATVRPSVTPGSTASPSPSAPETQADPPAVHFWGEIPEARQTAIRTRITNIVQFFDERFGVRVPGLEVHIGADDEALAEATLEAEGSSARVGFGQYRDGYLFVRADVAQHAIEHLYFHAIQDYLSQDQYYWGPWWLGEGTAEYAAHLFRTEQGEAAPGQALDDARLSASYTSVSLDALEQGSPMAPESFGTPSEALAELAVAWLIEQAGEASLVAYYRSLPQHAVWTDAFEATFALPFAEVYPAFAAYRADTIAVRREVRGAVLGPGGGPVEGWRIHIEALPSGAQRRSDLRDASSAGANGDFTLRLPDGTYVLSLSTRCGNAWVDLGWYGGESGFTQHAADAVEVNVEGQGGEGIVISLPALPDELAPQSCNLGPRRVVSGVVTDHAGAPVPGLRVTAFDVNLAFEPDTALVAKDGSFTLRVPDGIYQLNLYEPCGVWLGAYDVENDSFFEPPILDSRTTTEVHLPVDGEDITDVEIAVPSRGPDDVSQTLAEWVASRNAECR